MSQLLGGTHCCQKVQMGGAVHAVLLHWLGTATLLVHLGTCNNSGCTTNHLQANLDISMWRVCQECILVWVHAAAVVVHLYSLQGSIVARDAVRGVSPPFALHVVQVSSSVTAICAHIDSRTVGGVVSNGHTLQHWQRVCLQLVGFCGTGNLQCRSMPYSTSIFSLPSV